MLFLNIPQSVIEFDKMQIPLTADCGVLHSFYVKLVWRLSEFAFLCGGFGRRTFWFQELLCSEIYKFRLSLKRPQAESKDSACGVFIRLRGLPNLRGDLRGRQRPSLRRPRGRTDAP